MNLAARLQHAASPGEILVDTLTRKLCRHVVAFDPGRPIEAKGIGHVEACPAREITARLPSARPAFGELRAPLVGRHRELELLDTTYERVCEEKRPALLTVFGPAGIGKSRLVEDWIARKGHTALVGRCLPYGEGITFWPVREMLHVDGSITASDAREEVTAKVRASVLRAFGEGDADADAVARRSSSATSRRRRRSRTCSRRTSPRSSAGRCAAMSERRAKEALVVVFEDVQWAEPGLLDLIEHLAEWTRAPVDEEVLVDSIRRGLIQEVDERGVGGGRSYQFHHSLAREVTYTAVPKGERLRLHDRFGAWLEGIAGDRVGEYGETIAHHAEQAYRLARDLRSPRATELGTRAFHLIVSAATRARRRSDLNAATALYSRAAEIGEALGLPMTERVEAEGFSALTGYYVEGTSEAVARLDRVIDAARQIGPSEVLVRLLSQRGFISRTDESADRFFEEGIAVARATGDPQLIAHAITLSNAQAWARGDLVAHEVILREAYSFMKESGAKSDLGICLVWLATNALQRGDFTAAERYLDEATAEAETSGSKFQLWAVRRLAARAAIARAEHARAVRLANEAVALGHEVGAKRLVGLAYVRLGDALYEAGENAQARTILELALQTIDRETMRESYCEVRWKLSRAALAVGDREGAFAHAVAAREAAWDIYSNATSATTLAAVRDTEGDRAGAEQLYKEALTVVLPTGFAQLRADIQRELARHYVRYGDAASAEPLIDAVVEFYKDPLAARRREEAKALRRAAEASLPA